MRGKKSKNEHTGALQIPLFPRYFNLFLIGMFITGIPGIFASGFFRVTPGKAIASCLLLLLTCAEVIPFQPLGAAFRPIWSNYTKEINSDPGLGNVTPWYPGWGEELYMAYRRLKDERMLRVEPVHLYCNFPRHSFTPPKKCNAERTREAAVSVERA